MNPSFHLSPLLEEFYQQYLVDQDVAEFVRRTSVRYSIGTLERLASSGSRNARRGAVLALGRVADYHSNAVVGRALNDSDRGVRSLAEAAVVKIWMRIGAAAQQRRLNAIAEQLDDCDYERAARLAGKLIQEAPWIAQAWYQRGMAYFHLAQFDAAVRDCHQALEINAYHFQAASLMGQASHSRGDLVAALESYRRALRLNPSMEEVRSRLIQLQRTLKGHEPPAA
ncbi:MAG: tetratricopeptide repeat protein [Planctomycetales bacterium]|nr:tetratricopeptide repeat protein [Planctomycetales bacterium]